MPKKNSGSGLLIVAVLVAVILIALASMRGQGPTLELASERAFVETDLHLSDAVGVNYELRPICFGLVQGQDYTLVFIAEKYMSATDALMAVTVRVPTSFAIHEAPNGVTPSSPLSVQVTDKRVELTFFVTPQSQGDFILEGTAINTVLSFSSTNQIYVEVRASVEEARTPCTIVPTTLVPSTITPQCPPYQCPIGQYLNPISCNCVTVTSISTTSSVASTATSSGIESCTTTTTLYADINKCKYAPLPVMSCPRQVLAQCPQECPTGWARSACACGSCVPTWVIDFWNWFRCLFGYCTT